MSKLLRFALSFGAIAAALIGIVHVQPGWAASLSMDWWSLSDLEQTMERQLRQTIELDEQREQAASRASARQSIVEEVAADRMTLIQAAVEFRRLNQTLPPGPWSYNHAYSGESEGERLCRYVIRLVQINLSERTPQLVAAKTEQLNGELRVLLQQDGIVHLPEY
jgi:hypothetical protein